jgi:hypothetical protein
MVLYAILTLYFTSKINYSSAHIPLFSLTVFSHPLFFFYKLNTLQVGSEVLKQCLAQAHITLGHPTTINCPQFVTHITQLVHKLNIRSVITTTACSFGTPS